MRNWFIKLMLFASLLAVALPASAGDVAKTETHGPTRLFLVIDTSGSMVEAKRLNAAKDAATALVRALPEERGVTVELAEAADRVDVVDVFNLGDAAAQQRLVDAIDGLAPRRRTRTEFRLVDQALVELISRDVQPEEHAALVVMTDAISDEPGRDLRAEDLGERSMRLERGVVAVLAGDVPAAGALQRKPAPGATPLRSASRSGVVALLASVPPRVARIDSRRVPQHTSLLGGAVPVEFSVHVTNDAGLPQAVTIEGNSEVPVEMDPPSITLAPAETREVDLKVSLPKAATDRMLLPLTVVFAGKRTTSMLAVGVESRSWGSSNWKLLMIALLGLAATSIGILAHARKRVSITSTNTPGVLIPVALGEPVSLSSFSGKPGANIGTLTRSMFGWIVEAGGENLIVDGKELAPGARAPFHLGGRIDTHELSLGCIQRSTESGTTAPSPLAFTQGGFNERPEWNA